LRLISINNNATSAPPEYVLVEGLRKIPDFIEHFTHPAFIARAHLSSFRMNISAAEEKIKCSLWSTPDRQSALRARPASVHFDEPDWLRRIHEVRNQ